MQTDEHLLHRSVLLYNRGQVYAGLGLVDEAIADYTAVIAVDPNYAEYYFDRGNLSRRRGDNQAALADYETVMRLSPPFPEVYYNRGDIRAAEGDLEGALEDFGYVLELDPSFVNAYVNRAGLLVDCGEHEAARRDVEAGLRLDEASAELRCILGQIEDAAGSTTAARLAFDTAITADPTLQDAWVSRASLSFDEGDLAGAVADLDRALELGESAAVRFNRAVALQAQQRWADALADLERAVELAPDDPDALAERDRCRRQLTAV